MLKNLCALRTDINHKGGTMQQSIIIDTRAAVIICPDSDKAAEYIRSLLSEAMERPEGLKFTIETKPTDQVQRFLAGNPDDDRRSVLRETVNKNLAALKAKRLADPPAPAAKKAKPPAGGQAATVQKPKTGKVKSGTNRSSVLDCVNKCTKTTAIDCSEIGKRTGLGPESISPMMTELFKAGLVSRIEGKPLKFFRRQAEQKAGSGQVVCPARSGKVIPIDDCVPNDASPVCRGCENLNT